MNAVQNQPRSSQAMRRLLVVCALLQLGTGAGHAAPEGAAESRTYNPGVFTGIEVSGSAVVRFEQGASEQVVVQGDDEVQRAVTLEVLPNGVLNIRTLGAWRFWADRRPQLLITARELKRVGISGAADFTVLQPLVAQVLSITISGAGLARMDQLSAEELRFSVSGSGDGQFAGSVKQLRVSVAGRGDFRGENLQSQRTSVSISGIGTAKVWAVDELSVSVSGIGSVDYWGTPNVKRSSSGLVKINERGAKAGVP